MSGYGIGQKPLTCFGIDLARPVDRVAPGKWPILENVTSVVDGTVTPRAGLGSSAYATGPASKTPWHSLRTLNDPTSGAGVWSRVSGIGDRLCDERSSAPATINNLLGGFSGNPLSLVQARPSESPQPWMYVADSLLMRKVSVAGTVHSIGLPAPTSVPDAIVDEAFFRTVDLFEATTGWAAAGPAGAPTLLSAGPGRPIDTGYFSTSSRTKEFSSSGSLLCIVPASMANIVVGAVVNMIVAGGIGTEDVLVTETHSGSATVAITAILYDSGTTGLCTMVLATSPREIEVNSVLLVTGVASAGTEYVRVREVQRGVDGSIAVRVKTTTARAATDTVAAKPSFTCSPFNLIDDTTTIKSDGMRSAITVTTSGTPATLSKVASLDLSSAIFGSFTRASALDDYMSIVFRCDHPDLITEIRVMLDCDTASVTAGAFTGSEFTRNYFLRAITASDLSQLLKFNQTALTNRQDQITKRHLDFLGGSSNSEIGFTLNRRPGDDTEIGPNDRQDRLLDSPSGSDVTTDPTQPSPPSRDQLGPGENQFFNIRFRLSEMQRIGSDDSRGFHDIVGLRIAVLTAGSINLDFDSWVVFGGIEPEVDDLDEGYRYAYRGRVSSTGVVSNLSPASQSPARPVRQSVYVTFTQHPTTECDKLDIFRRGGSAAIPGWRYIATIDNSATPTFTDTVSNGAALAVPEESGYDNFQLWPLPQRPSKGTATTVAGTLVKDNGTNFALAWAPGMPFTANGVQSQVRRVLSTSLLELESNVGGGSSVAWEAPAPTLLAQPLPILFEWQGAHRLIALGDPANPGAFYVTHQSDADSTIETLRYEIPGAILQNGITYNGTPYIWSTERQYRIEDGGFDANGHLILRAVEVPGSRGLAARWACCGGDRMYWLAKDGICGSDGGAPTLITDDDLYPLFPHKGLPGVAVNGFNPPTISSANEPNTRLSWGDGHIYFNFVDSASVRRTLEFRKRGGPETSGWFPHRYLADSPGVTHHYFEEGANKHAVFVLGADTTTAKLYQLTEATSDAGQSIVATAQTQSENVGDPRKRKRWGDTTTEVDTDGASVAVVIGFDNHTSTLTPSTSPVTGSAGTRQITIHDVTDGVTVGGGREATNIDIRFTVTVTTQRPKLLTWEPTWIDRPEVTSKRASDFEDGGESGTKSANALRLRVDTKGASRSVVVQIDGDGTTNVATLTGITSPGYGPTWVTKAFPSLIVYRTMRVIPIDAGSWQLFDWECVHEPEPDLATHWETQQTTHDIDETWKCVRDALLTLRSTSPVTFSILNGDDRAVLYTTTLASTANARISLPLVLPAVKYKSAIYVLDGESPFALYVRDTWVRVRGWGRFPEWRQEKPFGDIHRAKGAVA